MTLDALLAAHPAPQGPRLLLHRGTCGDAVGGERLIEQLAMTPGAHVAALAEAACDGACWAAPAATVMREGHTHRFPRIDESGFDELDACLTGSCDADGYAGAGGRGLTARLGRTDGTLGDALAQGAYAAAARALAMTPERVLDAVEAAGLSGRGGAHFPTATKWRLVAAHEGRKLLLVNAEEGEPGVFKDRHLMEGDPHRLIEGIVIAAHATGVQEAIVYINGQARGARAFLLAAIRDARAAGILDGEALGATVDVAIELRAGAGGYVMGEESVLLNSIEGERPVPRFKPPFATDSGLWERPTVINNVETLCAATTIFDDPPPPTKLVPLSGAIPRPGLYEVPADGTMTWAGVLAMAGASPGNVKALLLGGPSGTFVPPAEFDAPLDMRGLGAGGTTVLGPDADIADIARDLARYNARESCGECTPCREGTLRLVELLDDDPMANRGRIEELIEVMTEASLCQLGGMAGRPVASALEHFPEAWQATDSAPAGGEA